MIKNRLFGAEFLLAEVTAFELDGDVKTVKTGRGEYRCFGVLLATGAHPRMIGFPGEAEFRGRGIAYCATCDGEFFTGKEVFVIGGGFAAAEPAKPQSISTLAPPPSTNSILPELPLNTGQKRILVLVPIIMSCLS